MNSLFNRHAPSRSIFLRARVVLFTTVALFLFAALAARSVNAAGTISGTAYRDFNGNGVQDAGDVGIGGIQVAVFDSVNAAQGTATTASNGTYTTGTNSGTPPYRVEFTIPASPDPLSYYKPAAEGTSNDTSVQFVPDGTQNGVDFGVNYPADFCENNPKLCTSAQYNGLRTGSTLDALYKWDYNDTNNDVNSDPVDTKTTTFADIGSTWGLGLAKSAKQLYIAAFLRRHADIGPGGGAVPEPYGSIYVRDLTGSGAATFFTTIPNAGTVSVRDLGSDTSPNHDTEAFAKVGKVGLGGVAVSDDETTLYVVNLNDKLVYAVPLSGAPTPVALAATPTAGVAACNGEYRPFAAHFWHGLLYVGQVCDASGAGATKADLHAYVYTYDPVTTTWNTTPVLSASLQYAPNKGSLLNCNTATTPFFNGDYGYFPWSDDGTQATLGATNSDYYCRNSGTGVSPFPHYVLHAMPVLSDIDFDVDGSMMLGIMDRWNAMIGWRNYGPEAADTTLYGSVTGGDILRACDYANTGTWLMESNGVCDGVQTGSGGTTPSGYPTGGFGDGQGLGGGEFYWGDQTPSDASQKESTEGGIAFVPGKGAVLSTTQDAIGSFSQGVIFFSNTVGNNSRVGEYLYGNVPNSTLLPQFAKTNGLGDLIALCNAAPVEIGNRIWNDTNGDGLQGAGEAALAGLDVTLWVDTNDDTIPDTQIATTRTDANGNYYFSNDPRGYGGSGNTAPNDTTGANGGFVSTGQGGRASTASHKYGLLGLVSGRAFEIRVDTTSGQNAPILTGLSLTQPNAGSKDTIDSDATTVGINAVIAGTTGQAGFNDHTYDIGFAPPTILGTIGNRVWIDEDSNGYQDKGEDGIPNVTVQLKDSGGSVIATTITDSDGGYLFTDLPAGTYYVQVLGSTIPSGMTQTSTYPNNGGDFYNQNQSGTGYQIALGSGEHNLTADFGYNWNPTTDVTTGGTTDTVAALGDRVWFDTNSNGRQDEGEVGIAGVTVTLLNSTGGVVTTTTTDATGYYMFDGLTPGAYSVQIAPAGNTGAGQPLNGLTQTGDPDHFGTTGTNDNITTIPIVLGPGDVFLNADFGYVGGPVGSIGNFVWYDRNADGVGPTVGGEPHGAAPGNDNTEFGIAGVTVVLIRDTNGNGEWDSGEPIIATTHTSDGTEDVDGDGTIDYLGYYNFRGLPVTDGVGTDDYIVWVNDAHNVLAGLRATYDQDGAGLPAAGMVTGLGISSVADLTTTPVIDQDFGYTDNEVLDMPANSGVLGDRVWLDTNGDGVQDTGEPGIPGVTVNLYDSTGTTLLATTTTGFDGHYLFPNLPTSAGGITYVVRVDPTTLPGSLTQTYDYSGGLDNESTRTLTDASPIQLDQDFGYRGLGTIGNLVWNDVNADGNQDSGELGFEGVTLDLYFDANHNGKIDVGDIYMGTKTTDANGGYLFTGLPTTDNTAPADYLVQVSDTAGILTGYWHSLGANPNSTTDTNGAETQATSHNDPVPVQLTGAVPNNRNADFGYYLIPGAVGNYVWYDTNADGIQDGTEVGINGATVTLTIRYPGADNILNTSDDTVTTLTTTTSADPTNTRDGYYSFGNLLQDEEYNGLGTYYTEPLHTITVTLPAGYSASPTGQGTPTTDSNDPTGTVGQPYKGQTDTLFSNDSAAISSYDFGIYQLELTGTVFLDIYNGSYNGNLDDPSETPNGGAESGLTVYLYVDANNDNIPDGASIQTTVTGATGDYAFTGLQPGRYIVSVVQPAGWRSTIDNYNATDTNNPQTGANNNDNGIGGVEGQIFSHSFNLIAGSAGANNVVDNNTATTSNDRLDFGMNQSPTAAEMEDVTAQSPDATSVVVNWQTLNERLVSGFNVQRSATQDDGYANVNSAFIAAKTPGSDLGNAYTFTDSSVADGATYWYRIELTRSDSSIDYSDPVQVTVGASACTSKPLAPALVTPLKNEVVKHEKAKFAWQAVPCAVTYKIQVRQGSQDGKSVFTKNALKKIKAATKKLQARVPYVWRISACNAANQCTASAWVPFKVK